MTELKTNLRRSANRRVRLVRLARRIRPIFAAALAISMVLAVFLSIRVQATLAEIEQQPTDNLNWNVTQIELDLVLLIEATNLALLAPEADLSAVRRRFDQFYSRAHGVISDSDLPTLGRLDLVDPLGREFSKFVDKIVPLINSDDAMLRDNLAVIASEAVTLRAKTRKTAIEMISHSKQLSDARRAEFATLVNRLALSFAVAAAILGILLMVAIWLNRDAERWARATARISERLAATVNSALDAIIVADQGGLIIQYNPSAQSIFGFEPHEAIGQSFGNLIAPHRMQSAHESVIHRMQQTGEMQLVNFGRFQTVGLRKSGEEFPIEVSISESNGEDGRIFIAYLRDISDRVAGEAALTTARDRALAADRAKTSFIAVMSHEMRTPLNGVLASLDIARRMATDARQLHFIDLARDSGSQLLRHANEVLDISRIDSDALKIADEPCNVEALLRGIIEAQKPVCAEKGLTLDLHRLDDIPELCGDPFRIGQIVQNFLSNAIKFTAEGGIVVELERQEDHHDIQVIEIRVIDTGLGIPEADHERIFNDFVMLDQSFSRSVGGAGLGLAISRRLARAMGGDIGVESDEGEGSVFWVRLPMTVSKNRDVKAAEVEVPPLTRCEGNPPIVNGVHP